MLAHLLQASHELVPPDELVPVAKHIANKFVNDRSRNEARIGIAFFIQIAFMPPNQVRETQRVWSY